MSTKTCRGCGHVGTATHAGAIYSGFATGMLFPSWSSETGPGLSQPLCSACAQTMRDCLEHLKADNTLDHPSYCPLCGHDPNDEDP